MPKKRPFPHHKAASNPPAGNAILRQEKIMRNTPLSPLCAVCLLVMLLCPLSAGAAQPQKNISSPLTITVQEAEPGQMLILGSSPEDSDLRVGALICRPLAEQAVDRKKTGGSRSGTHACRRACCCRGLTSATALRTAFMPYLFGTCVAARSAGTYCENFV